MQVWIELSQLGADFLSDRTWNDVLLKVIRGVVRCSFLQERSKWSLVLIQRQQGYGNAWRGGGYTSRLLALLPASIERRQCRRNPATRMAATAAVVCHQRHSTYSNEPFPRQSSWFRQVPMMFIAETFFALSWTGTCAFSELAKVIINCFSLWCTCPKLLFVFYNYLKKLKIYRFILFSNCIVNCVLFVY